MKTTRLTLDPAPAPNSEPGGGTPPPPAGGTPPPAGGTPPPTAPTDWRSSISEDIRNDPLFKDIKAKDEKEALGIVAKQLHGIQPKIGSKLVKPAADAKPEEVKAFYKELGVPDAPEGYQFKKLEAPEGYPVSEGLSTQAAKLFHKANLTPEQANILLEGFHEGSVEGWKGMQANQTAALKQIEDRQKQTWGAEHDANKALMTKVVASQGEEFQKMLDETGAGHDPRMIGALVNFGKMVSEDKLRAPGTPPAGAQGELDVNQALVEFNKDPEMAKALARPWYSGDTKKGERAGLTHAIALTEYQKLMDRLKGKDQPAQGAPKTQKAG
jgi:hypothetical protein